MKTVIYLNGDYRIERLIEIIKENTPDFILDTECPKEFTIVSTNKGMFNGNLYSWSSDNKGWIKDTVKPL